MAEKDPDPFSSSVDLDPSLKSKNVLRGAIVPAAKVRRVLLWKKWLEEVATLVNRIPIMVQTAHPRGLIARARVLIKECP